MICLGPFTVVQARRFIAEKEKLLRAFLAFATIELSQRVENNGYECKLNKNLKNGKKQQKMVKNLKKGLINQVFSIFLNDIYFFTKLAMNLFVLSNNTVETNTRLEHNWTQRSKIPIPIPSCRHCCFVGYEGEKVRYICSHPFSLLS